MKINVNREWIYNSKDGKEEVIDFPLDMMLKENRDLKNPSGNDCSYFSGGIYHFKKIFNFDVSAYNYFALYFEQVYKKAVIKLNGEIIYENLNGLSDFYVEFSPKNGENLIEIIAYNNLVPNLRWYSGSGVLRDVSLIYKKANEIYDLKLDTLSYLTKKIEIKVKIKENVDYIFEIYDLKNNLLYKGKDHIIELSDAKLWSLDQPNLYKLIVKTKNDSEEINFGIREISLSKDKGFILNGEPLILKGCCIHGDNGVLGAVSYKEYEYLKVKRLKEAGFNAIRCAHNPASINFLNVCDELGILVIDEAFDGWYTPKDYHDISRIFFKVFEKTLKNMINKDYNHPSVIMYSLGNEISEVASKKGINVLAKMSNLVKSLDKNRYTTIGVNLLICVYLKLGLNIYKENKKYQEVELDKVDKKIKQKKSGSTIFNMMMQKLGSLMFLMAKTSIADKIASEVAKNVDVLGINYGSSRYEKDSKKYPNRFMIGSETLIKHLSLNYNYSKKIPTVIGDFIWSGIDYLGEALVNDYHYYSYKGLPLLCGAGVFDFTLKGNSELTYCQYAWNNILKPNINLYPLNHYNEVPFKSAWRFTNSVHTYNFKKYQNKKFVVEVFSSATFIKLMINDKFIGIKKVKDYRAIFKSRYQIGKIEAIALDNNKKEIERSYLLSGNEIRLNVSLSKNKIKNDSNDLIFMEMEFVDENNIIYSDIETPINIETSDNISLFGMGSAITSTNESYLSNKFNSYQGRAVAIFKSNSSKSGKAQIKIINNVTGLKEIEVEVIDND